MKKSCTLWSALALLALATACAKSSPTQPTGTSTPSQTSTASSGGVSTPESATMTTPGLVSPADNAQIKFAQQPITLTVNNAVTTGRGTVTYSFEVATDSGFANKVATKDGVAQGANGRTSVTLDKLKGATSYFWRARIMLNQTSGPYSRARGFAVGPEVVLQAPVLAAPGAQATVGEQPTLTVNNVQRSGPAGTIVYTFEVSQASDFGSIADSGTETEQPNTAATTHTVASHLNDKTTYWWRVQATDTTNSVTSPWSNANPFTVQKFDMRNAVIYDNQPDVASWPETAKITYVDTAGPYIVVDFDRRTGPGRWNDVGFGDGSLEYTLGACFNIDSQWYCSAAVQFWYGRELQAGGPVSEMALNWYYNPARWGRMTGHQPEPGETIGIWVGQGNLRGGDGYTYKERSNVQLVQFGTVFQASSMMRLPLTTNSLGSALGSAGSPATPKIRVRSPR